MTFIRIGLGLDGNLHASRGSSFGPRKRTRKRQTKRHVWTVPDINALAGLTHAAGLSGTGPTS